MQSSMSRGSGEWRYAQTVCISNVWRDRNALRAFAKTSHKQMACFIAGCPAELAWALSCVESCIGGLRPREG